MPSRTLNAVAWTLQVLLAATYLFAGGSKLAGAPMMVQMFDAIGFGQWFRYLTGGLEVIGAVGLLVPQVAPFAAILLAVVMIGAVGTHLFLIGGSPVMPLVLFVGLCAIVWIRRHQIARSPIA